MNFLDGTLLIITGIAFLVRFVMIKKVWITGRAVQTAPLTA